MMIFCNPHNPTGRIWNKEHVEKIVNICHKNNLFISKKEGGGREKRNLKKCSSSQLPRTESGHRRIGTKLSRNKVEKQRERERERRLKDRSYKGKTEEIDITD